MAVRILGVSDIHGNVSAVAKLREVEHNEFDLLVLAGDIGDDNADAVFGILSTFGCPVLYVYGNWDGDLAYDRWFGPSCHHLHMNPFEYGGYTFAGFSGLPTKWGHNPHALRLEAEVRSRHHAILDAVESLTVRYDAARAEICDEYDREIATLNATGLKTSGGTYLNRFHELERWRIGRLNAASAERDKLMEGREYADYRKDHDATYPEILRLNRTELSGIVRDIGRERTVVVTHERLPRAYEDLPGVPLFIYGHRHGFEDKTYRGSRFVNVSALENCVTVRPIDPKAAGWNLRNVNAGGYVVLDIDASGVRASPKYLPLNMDEVVRAEGWRMFAGAVED